MEGSFVSRVEIENIFMEMKRLQYFLADTFGTKFVDFCKKDKIDEVEKRLMKEHPDLIKNLSHLCLKSPRSQPTADLWNQDPLEENEITVPNVTVTASLNHTAFDCTKPCNEQSTLKVPPTQPLPYPAVVTSKRFLPTAGMMWNQDPKENVIVPNVTVDTIGTVRPCVKINPPKAFSEKISSAPLPRPPPISKDPGVVPVFPSNAVTISLISSRQKQQSNSSTECISLDDDEKSGEKQPEPTTLTSNPISRNGISIARMDSSQMPSSQMERLNSGSSGQSKRLPSLRKRARSSISQKECSDEVIQCDQCQLFIYSSQLQDHRKKHSIMNPKLTGKDSQVVSRPSLSCPTCDIPLEDLQMYDLHCNASHPNSNCTICPLSTCRKRLCSKPKLKRHFRIHTQDSFRFTCKVCGKTYTRRDNLQQHTKTHNNSTPEIFYCMVCSFAFSSKKGRDDHVLTCHKNDESVQEFLSSLNNGERTSANECSNSEVTNSTPNSFVVGDGISDTKIKIDSGPVLGFEYEGDEDDEMC